MRIRCLAACSLLLLANPAHAEAPAIIDQARAFLGSEADLNAVQAVRYQGQLTSTDTSGSGETRTVEAQIEIVFQRPMRQRIVARAGTKVEITALDDYEAWQWVEDIANPASARLTLLGKEQVKRLRSNTWENLSFFRAADSALGEIVDHGRVDLEGRPAHKVSFVHDTNIVFVRYFDPETGQLLQTETGRGDRIREDGAIVVQGVRFPERVITDTTLPGGGHRTVTVVFDEVVVNEPLPPDAFSVPMLGERPAL